MAKRLRTDNRRESAGGDKQRHIGSVPRRRSDVPHPGQRRARHRSQHQRQSRKHRAGASQREPSIAVTTGRKHAVCVGQENDLFEQGRVAVPLRRDEHERRAEQNGRAAGQDPFDVAIVQKVVGEPRFDRIRIVLRNRIHADRLCLLRSDGKERRALLPTRQKQRPFPVASALERSRRNSKNRGSLHRLNCATRGVSARHRRL